MLSDLIKFYETAPLEEVTERLLKAGIDFVSNEKESNIKQQKYTYANEEFFANERLPIQKINIPTNHLKNSYLKISINVDCIDSDFSSFDRWVA